jgi:hypothetical protein
MFCATSVAPHYYVGRFQPRSFYRLERLEVLSLVSVCIDNIPLLLLADQTVQPISKFGLLRTWHCEALHHDWLAIA